jgi:hypothetical protein
MLSRVITETEVLLNLTDDEKSIQRLINQSPVDKIDRSTLPELEKGVE